MNKPLNKIEKLIAELCPEGLEFKSIGEICQINRGRVMSKDYLRNNAGAYPVYSSQTVDDGVFGRINTYDYDGEYLTWTTDGANAGSIFYRNGKFSITNVCGLLKVKVDGVNTKFLLYILATVSKKYVSAGMGNPKIMSNVMEKIQIPIPPLAIQQEIVKILDTFTTLEARKKQYEYYRDELLTFGDDVEWRTLGEVCEMKAGKSISASDISSLRSENNVYPCIGGNGLRGYVDSFSHSGKFPIIGRQGALCGNVCFAEGDFYATEHAVVVRCGEQFTDRFLYHLLLLMNLNQYATGGAQPGLAVSKLEKIKIPIPPLAEQQRIVAILDKFDALVNDISVGLPAELNARRNQYEYYRNKLLTFKNSPLREGNHPALTGTPPQEGNEKHPAQEGNEI